MNQRLCKVIGKLRHHFGIVAEFTDDIEHNDIKDCIGDFTDKASEREYSALKTLARFHLKVVNNVGEHGNQKHRDDTDGEVRKET